MSKRQSFPSRAKARRIQALEQVKARIAENGRPSETSPERKQEITPEKQRQRLEQAKYERDLLEKRV